MGRRHHRRRFIPLDLFARPSPQVQICNGDGGIADGAGRSPVPDSGGRRGTRNELPQNSKMKRGWTLHTTPGWIRPTVTGPDGDDVELMPLFVDQTEEGAAAVRHTDPHGGRRGTRNERPQNRTRNEHPQNSRMKRGWTPHTTPGWIRPTVTGPDGDDVELMPLFVDQTEKGAAAVRHTDPHGWMARNFPRLCERKPRKSVRWTTTTTFSFLKMAGVYSVISDTSTGVPAKGMDYWHKDVDVTSVFRGWINQLRPSNSADWQEEPDVTDAKFSLVPYQPPANVPSIVEDESEREYDSGYDSEERSSDGGGSPGLSGCAPGGEAGGAPCGEADAVGKGIPVRYLQYSWMPVAWCGLWWWQLVPLVVWTGWSVPSQRGAFGNGPLWCPASS
ncbi:hypothetical protein BV898_03952 [Hypsibius exemplaris]|uniref:Uncharacterized protein n=1 Tax=Hypsibius exemplaris TaxID=2072580 RepID=A0A1W0X3H6_HYPEX|nr:hypothetical protein BV898_03952 [Hypsibius exemplaris]